MKNGRARIAICISMIMSVALIATVVQHSENGIILEDDSTDADQLAKDLLDPKLIHEKTVAAISHQQKVVNSIVRLRAFCIGTHKQAQEFLETNTKSSESAFPAFIIAFGKPTPTPVKPQTEVKNGIEYTQHKNFVPAYNVVVAYGRAMGVARGKFTKGINKYILDSIDTAINKGEDVVTGFTNNHLKRPSRIGLATQYAGFTSRPDYIAKLSAPLESFSEAAAKEAKLADSADVQRATGLLKSGAHAAYHSFLKEAYMKEENRLAAHMAAKVARSEAAIKAKAANPSTSDTFEYVKELSPAGAKANEDVDDVERKSDKEIRMDAKKASEEWVKNKLTRRKAVILNDQIKKVEENAKKKAAADKIAAEEAKAAAEKAAADKAVVDAAAEIKAAQDAEAKAASDKKAAEDKAASDQKAAADEAAAAYKAKADADLKKAEEDKAAADKKAEDALLASTLATLKGMLAPGHCADEGETCNCAGGEVMYAAIDDKTAEVKSTKKKTSGTSLCTKDLTGVDPAPTLVKACYCRK